SGKSGPALPATRTDGARRRAAPAGPTGRETSPTKPARTRRRTRWGRRARTRKGSPSPVVSFGLAESIRSTDGQRIDVGAARTDGREADAVGSGLQGDRYAHRAPA